MEHTHFQCHEVVVLVVGLVETDTQDTENRLISIVVIRTSGGGTLPDSSYGRNTEIQYCCRNDGRHNRLMVLPTRRPFILYRYGGRCQRVRGMRTDELYIKWEDENIRNRDNCKGDHPDATCRGNQLLRFCYYSR